MASEMYWVLSCSRNNFAGAVTSSTPYMASHRFNNYIYIRKDITKIGQEVIYNKMGVRVRKKKIRF